MNMSVALEQFLKHHFGTACIIFLAAITALIGFQIWRNPEYRRMASESAAAACPHFQWRHTYFLLIWH
jgi:hypothetical protein